MRPFGIRPIQRPLRAAAYAVAGLAGALLTPDAQAQIPAIDRVFLWQVAARPDETGRITVRVQNSGSLDGNDTLRARVTGLDGEVLSDETRAPAGEYTNFDFPAGLPEGGHLLEVELYDSALKLDEEERIYSVVADTADDVRYGFYTLFGSVGGNYTAKTDLLTDCYLNAIEYYDWFPAHGDYTPDSASYTQPPFGFHIEVGDIQNKISEARAKNILAIAYTAAYAADPPVLSAFPNGHLTNAGGDNIAFYNGNVGREADLGGVWYYLTAFAPDTAWNTHLMNELRTSLDGSGMVTFDGYELDTYGWNEPYYSPGSSFNGTPMSTMLAKLTSDVQALVQEERPGGLTTLNNIAEEGIEQFYDVSDFLFVENWDFHKPRYDQVAAMVANRVAESGKRFVSKCYPADMNPSQTSWPNANLRLLMGAHLYGGGSFMVAGEPKEDTGEIRGLNSLFYPDAQVQSAANFATIRQYNGHDAALYRINHGPGVQPRETDLAIAGTLAHSYRTAEGGAAWTLLHLDGASEWTTTTAAPSTLTNLVVTLTLPNGLVPEDVLYGSPDDAATVFPRPINWTETSPGVIECTIPQLQTFGTVIVVPQDLALTTADSAEDAAYGGGWAGGPSGGAGWAGDWQITGASPTSGAFIGSSASNGPAAAEADRDIDTGGRAWGLYNQSTATVMEASRSFTPLDTGQSLRLHMDNGYMNTGGSAGFGLRNASGENLFEFYFRGGEGQYFVQDSLGERMTALPFTTAGLDIEFTLTAPTAYSLRVVPFGEESATITLTGSLAPVSGSLDIETLRLFNFNAGTGAAYDVFFNDVSIYRKDAASRVEGWAVF
ncbi:MAG: glycoside hydrolase family 66 protein [Sumerlaeia bacterium]